jgi:P4 family phage/plasmid primase-like protien
MEWVGAPGHRREGSALTMDFKKLLNKYKTEKGQQYTHTSIGNPKISIHVPDADMPAFMECYKSAMIRGMDLHMTERPKNPSPFRVDLDFRFPLPTPAPAPTAADAGTDEAGTAVLARRYTIDHIRNILLAYNRFLAENIQAEPEAFRSYVMEKPAPSDHRGKLKDGLHIVWPHMVVTHAFQHFVRKAILDTAADVFHGLDLCNSYEEIVDKAIIDRNNWQMYGSKKPDNPAYEVTLVYDYCPATHTLTPVSRPPASETLAWVELLSMRNKTEATLMRQGRAEVIDAYTKHVLPTIDDRRKNKLHSQIFGTVTNITRNLIASDEFDLAKELVGCLNPTRADSYEDWIKLGWTLRNIDYRLLGVWVDFSRESAKYVEGECQKMWDCMRLTSISMGTLRWWARLDNPTRYDEIINSNVVTLIDKCANNEGAHYDVACVVHAMFKDRYQYTIRDTWFTYRDEKHRWVRNKEGIQLRNVLSTAVCQAFIKRVLFWTQQAAVDQEHAETHHKRASMLHKIALKLRISGYKDSVMKECKCLFTDEKFDELLDSHPHLIGFENGVYDLHLHQFRDGLPDDYISFSTGRIYRPFDPKMAEVSEIHDFFAKVFGNKDVRRYVWDVMASILDGSIRHEKFYVCTGSGCHAKDAEVMMYDGSIKLVQDVEIGDQLMGDDSTPRTVQELFRGEDNMVRIVPVKGDPFTVTLDHVLTVQRMGKVIDVKVRDLMLSAAGEDAVPTFLVRPNGVEFPDTNKPFGMDPFVMGCALMGARRIPMQYLTASREARLELLSGLLGVVDRDLGRCDAGLLEDVLFVVRSLGRDHELINRIPAALADKAALVDGFRIEAAGRGDYYGFELDGNHRYLMGDFTVTHNSNGKSKILELVQRAVGDYYCILPIALLTQKRAQSNSAQAELERTKGRRFAVMQEPSEGEKINIGLMKELSGGDRIQCRGLFKEPIEFRPQFKMIMTCNELPEVPSDDNGTWRRIRVVDFRSKFCEAPDPKNPNEILVDTELADKFDRWADPFISMLIEHHRVTELKTIQEPMDVRIATESYKANNDVIGQFLEDKFVIDETCDDRLMLRTAMMEFRTWAFQNVSRAKKLPDRNQFRAYLEKTYGPYPKDGRGWKHVRVIAAESDDGIDEV